ncbi:hypothetical protein PIROE2DRAFT_57126 [Piromyces sp. E2]|nr:hypothetical protein PIROE2DRAFT_57126 [Piromyces sp. E2]|eukprot:OUM69868.1 hypothetical protein PIROE2DRAFT_57126 [Piromyces sp. E2]
MGIDECYSQKKIVPVIDKAREEIQKQIEIVEKKKRDNQDAKYKKDCSIDKKDDEETSMNDISKTLSNDDIDISDIKEDEKTSYETLLVDQLQNDIQLKEELLEGLLNSQKEYNVMRLKYEEKLKLLQNMLTSAQKDRDLALKKMNETEDDGKKEKVSFDQKRKLEEKIKKLENEISQLKLKYKNKDKSYSLSKNQNDNLIKNLKNNIESLKNEKTKLLQKIKSEVEKNRRIQLSNEQEIVRLRRREKEASMLAEKLEKSNQIQKALLKKKNEEALNSSKKIKSMMLLLNKNKSQTQIHNPRTKSSTVLYQQRKLSSANSSVSTTALYHSKSQSDASRKKLTSKAKTPLKTPEKGSKLLSLQVQWKKQSIDKEIDQFTINQELQVLYNDLLEKKIRLELKRKEILENNFRNKTDLDVPEEALLSAFESEMINDIDTEIKSIENKIDKINQLNDIYNINESIHNNIISYVSNILKNMISENIQQLMKIYIKELIELRSNFIYSIFHSNMDSECLDNLLIELKTAKKPYNLIKYYSKESYSERHPKDNNNLSYIKDNEIINNNDNENQIVDNQIIDDNNNNRQISFLEKKNTTNKNHFKMEDEYNRMLRSLESLYNIKIQEEKDNDNYEKFQNENIYKSDENLNNNHDKGEYNVDEYYFSNHKRNLSEQNAIIYSNMINALQQKLNQQKNTPSNSNGEKNNTDETSKSLIHQRSRSLSDLEVESIKNSKEIINIQEDKSTINKFNKTRSINSLDSNKTNKVDVNNKFRRKSFSNVNSNNNNNNNNNYLNPNNNGINYRRRSITGNYADTNNNIVKSNNLSKSSSYNASINDLSRKDIPLKQNYSEYISKRISNKTTPKDDYEKTVDRLKCSITEKICNDIKKEIQDTYDIDISKKTNKNNKLRYDNNHVNSQEAPVVYANENHNKLRRENEPLGYEEDDNDIPFPFFAKKLFWIYKIVYGKEIPQNLNVFNEENNNKNSFLTSKDIYNDNRLAEISNEINNPVIDKIIKFNKNNKNSNKALVSSINKELYLDESSSISIPPSIETFEASLELQPNHNSKDLTVINGSPVEHTKVIENQKNVKSNFQNNTYETDEVKENENNTLVNTNNNENITNAIDHINSNPKSILFNHVQNNTKDIIRQEYLNRKSDLKAYWPTFTFTYEDPSSKDFTTSIQKKSPFSPYLQYLILLNKELSKKNEKEKVEQTNKDTMVGGYIVINKDIKGSWTNTEIMKYIKKQRVVNNELNLLIPLKCVVYDCSPFNKYMKKEKVMYYIRLYQKLDIENHTAYVDMIIENINSEDTYDYILLFSVPVEAFEMYICKNEKEINYHKAEVHIEHPNNEYEHFKISCILGPNNIIEFIQKLRECRGLNYDKTLPTLPQITNYDKNKENERKNKLTNAKYEMLKLRINNRKEE